MTYSVAIRTLGTGGEKYAQLLRSLATMQPAPEQVIVYIAQGYQRPEATYGQEQYIWVPKGMAAQRLLPYHEITSDYLLLLDDDVYLPPSSIPYLLDLIQEHHADCIGIDVYENHNLPLTTKLFAAITNWVRPHCSHTWAMKMHRSGSFSYNIRPTRDFYLSQSAPGLASLWRTQALKSLEIEQELWIDQLPFAYQDDMLLFYKLYANGGTLGYTYRSGIKHLDGGVASQGYRQSADRAYVRAMASVTVWHRAIYGTSKHKWLAALCFAAKWSWVSVVVTAGALLTLSPALCRQHFRGLRAGYRFIHSPAYLSLRPYRLKQG